MTDGAPGNSLGPVAHIGLVVADLENAMTLLSATGVRWSSVAQPLALLLHPDGTMERAPVRYVTAAGAEPRLKLIQGAPGGHFAAGEHPTAVHHLSYWVQDLEVATGQLVQRGYQVEVTGLAPDEVTPAYRYLVAPALVRIELGLRSDRARFDAWAG